MDGTRRWLDVAKQGGDWYNCMHCSTSPVAADKAAAEKAAEQAKIDGIVNRYIARPREQCYFTGTHASQINLLQKPRYQDQTPKSPI
jgi:hypothetical protein